MSKIRFHIAGEPSTDWEEEATWTGSGATAVLRVAELRRRYPHGKITVEREGDKRTPNIPTMYRFRIFVREGEVKVTDDEGVKVRKIKDAMMQSQPFLEADRDKVRASILEAIPNAHLVEEKASG